MPRDAPLSRSARYRRYKLPERRHIGDHNPIDSGEFPVTPPIVAMTQPRRSAAKPKEIPAAPEAEIARLAAELQEALDHQAATSDVLMAIRRAGGELDPVLEILVKTAARICKADHAAISRLYNDRNRTAATFGYPKELRDHILRNPEVL